MPSLFQGMHIAETFVLRCPGATVTLEQLEPARLRAVALGAQGEELAAVIVSGDLRQLGPRTAARNKVMAAAVRATETPEENAARRAREGIAQGQYVYGIDRELGAALLERVLFECERGHVRNPYSYALALCRNATIGQFREKQIAQRRVAKALAAAERALALAAEHEATRAREAALLSTFLSCTQGLEGTDAMHADVLRARKFERIDQAEEQRRFGGSRAARDQWVCRGRKRLVAFGIPKDLEAFLRVR